MAINRALFDIDDDGSDAGFTAEPGQTITLKLRNPNVGAWQLQVWSEDSYSPEATIFANPPRKSKNAPDVQLVGATTGAIVSPTVVDGEVTITLPDGGNGINSYIIRSVVDGGYTNRAIDPFKYHERIVAVVNGMGLRKPVVSELLQYEFDAWAGVVCDIIDYLNGIGSGGSGGSGSGVVISTVAAGSRQAVRVATASALPAYTRAGNVLTASANGALPAIDGTSLALNDRVLLVQGAGPSSAAHAGIYFVSSLGGAGSPWSLTRATDMDVGSEVEPGVHFWVLEGTANGDHLAVLTGPSSGITINTTALEFTLYDLSGESGLPAASKGDIYVFNGTEPDTVSIGTPGQLIAAGSGGMPEYIDADFQIFFEGDLVEGDTFYFDGSGVVPKGIGSKGDVWTVIDDGTPGWAPPATELPTDADDGDIPYWKTDHWEMLSVGPSGTVIGSVGGFPNYVAIDSGSGGGGSGFLAAGTKVGDMLRWDGSQWTPFNVGAKGTWLSSNGTNPTWDNLPVTEAGGVMLRARAAIVNNITLAGEQVAGGVDLDEGDYALVTGQNAAASNGLYVVDSGAWARAEEFDEAAEMGRAVAIAVEEGNFHDHIWLHTTAAQPVIPGTTPLSFRNVTPAEPLEDNSVLVAYGRNDWRWISGNDGTFLGYANGEAQFLELPDTGVIGTGPEVEPHLPSAWQSVTVDVALLVDDLPAHTIQPSGRLLANSNGAFPTVDGHTLIVGSPTGATLLLYGNGINCGLWRLSQQGSTTTRWELMRIGAEFTGIGSAGVIRANRNVGIRYGNNFAGEKFIHITPVNLSVPGNAPITIGTTEIVYVEGSAASVGNPDSIAEYVQVDVAHDRAESLALGFVTQTGNVIEHTTNNVQLVADGVQVTLGQTVLIYSSTPGIGGGGGGSSTMNGIWRMTRVQSPTERYRLERAPFADTAAKILAIRAVHVKSGLDNQAREFFNYTDPNTFVLNTTAVSMLREFDDESTQVEAQLAVHVSSLPAREYVGGDGTMIRGSVNGALPAIDGVVPAVANFDTYPILIYGETPVAGTWMLANAGSAGSRWEMYRTANLDTSKKKTRNKTVVVKNGTTNKGKVFTKTTRGTIGATQSFEYVDSGGGAAQAGTTVIARVAITIGTVPSFTAAGNRLTATANAAFPAIDGVAPSVGMRVLLFATGPNTGVFQFAQVGSSTTPWILDRVAELDTSTEVAANAGVHIQEGTLYAGKLFTRIGAGAITLNTTSLEWRLLDAGGLPTATLHGRPLVANASTGQFVQWSGGGTFEALVIDNLTTAASIRGLRVKQNGTNASRVCIERGAVSGEMLGAFGQFVAFGQLASEGHELGSVDFRVIQESGTGVFAVPSGNRMTGVALRGAMWTGGADGTVNSDFAYVLHGGIFANRASITESAGARWWLGAMREGGIQMGHLYFEATAVTSGVPTDNDLGTEQLANGALVDTGKSRVVVFQTTGGTQTAATKAQIAVPSNQTLELFWTVIARQSDNTDRLYAKGTATFDRINGGSATTIENENLLLEKTAGASGWGDASTIGPALSGNNVIFNVQGQAGQTISWKIYLSWLVG